jgi:hypothetical protein
MYGTDNVVYGRLTAVPVHPCRVLAGGGGSVLSPRGLKLLRKNLVRHGGGPEHNNQDPRLCCHQVPGIGAMLVGMDITCTNGTSFVISLPVKATHIRQNTKP